MAKAATKPKLREHRYGDQVIHLQEVRERITPRAVETAYTLRPDRGWVWLQRLCIAVLRRLQCYQVMDELKISVHRINQTAIGVYLARAYELPIDRGRQPSVVYMGRDEWHELTDNPKPNTGIEFNSILQIHRPHIRSRIPGDFHIPHVTYRNLPILVLPWMKRVLIV